MDSVNWSDLKKFSLEFSDHCRFSIKDLKIRVENYWKNMSELIGIQRTRRGHIYNFGLEEVLLDTGNQSGCCLITEHFYENFVKNFRNIRVRLKNIGTYKHPMPIVISAEEFEFKFHNGSFYSKIGFFLDCIDRNYKTQIPKGLKSTINIGINAIKQMINVIFPSELCNYYFCRNM